MMETSTSSSPSTKEACWREIGAWGNQTCDALKTHGHCHNCPVFVQAGRRLFQQAAPNDYVEDWTQLLASEQIEEHKVLHSAMVFRLGKDWLALKASLFAEVHEMTSIHRVPHVTNSKFLGIANLRGALHLCVSLTSVLGLESSKESHRTPNRTISPPRFIVLEKEGERWGFPVDEVEGLIRYSAGDLREPPVNVSKASHSYTREILVSGERHIALLDDELLFYHLKTQLF